jgi:hypothetical protein
VNYDHPVWLAIPVPDLALTKAVGYLKKIPLTLENLEDLRELIKVLEKPLLETDGERFLRRFISRDYQPGDPQLLVELEKVSAEHQKKRESQKVVAP